MLIVSKPVVNESKQDAKLLIENPIPLLAKPLRQSASKSKPQGRLRKRPCIENKAKHGGSIKAKALDESEIRTEDFHNHLVQKPRTD